MMCREIAEHVGMHRDDVAMVLARMNRRTPRRGKRTHITGWCMVLEGQRDYPRPIYALGDGVDKPKPKTKTRKDINRDRRSKERAFATMNFVFNLRAPLQRRARQVVAA